MKLVKFQIYYHYGAGLARSYECFQNLTGKPTGKRPLGGRKCRWEDNIILRMDVKEIGISTRNWVDDSAQDNDYWRALVNAVLNLRVP